MALFMHKVNPVRLYIIVAVIFLVAVPLFPVASAIPVNDSDNPPEANAGEAIYQRGLLGSGALLVADRGSGVRMTGVDAACINCHRRSGFGAKEGRITIPPITTRYLMSGGAQGNGDPYLPYVETMRLDHDVPYTEASLARAIREGISAEGRSLDYLMPHYALNDADMAALIGYLKSIDRRGMPGASDTVLHFATIITPDADPVKRRAMLDVIERYFDDRNIVQFAPSPRLHPSRKMSWVGSMFKVNRRWQLHVWQLTGPAKTWEAQLRRRFAKEPVLAVVSGLGGTNWEPVHAFCEHEAVPCLFPNVEAPPAGADGDFYSLYFSRGVLLEAELIANRVLEQGSKVVHQIYRAGDNGEAASKALAVALESRGIAVRSHVLPPGKAGKEVAKALRQASGADALVLWLRPPDIAALGKAPAKQVPVFMSGLMGGLDLSPLPAEWRSRTQVAYPFDLPERRRVPVDYALGWFAIRHIPLVDEQLQADTFLACGLLAETISDMADNFVPEYLVERMQDMLEHRIITGYYPHLALAPGQRFASKGGYFVRFDTQQTRRLVADSGWLVP